MKEKDTLRANIRSADTDSARKIAEYLYQLVDDQKIDSFKIKKITKGQSSVDFAPLVPFLGDIDFETWYQRAKESGLFTLGELYLGLRIIRAMLSIVKDGIEIGDKIKKKKSMFGISCNINTRPIVRYGRSFGVEPFDTILTSATPDSLQDTFYEERKWGEIKIAQEKYFLIQYIAIFVKKPKSAITHYGKVSHIEYNPETGKSTVFLEGKPKKLKKPVPCDKNWPQHNGHGALYTTMERIFDAKTMADVYASLDDRKK